MTADHSPEALRALDGTDRLCRALYGRKATARDYLGGSDAKMLHDAADRLAPTASLPDQVQVAIAELENLREQINYGHGDVRDEPHSLALKALAVLRALADRAPATFWVIERQNDIYKKPEYWTPCPSSNWVFSITSACQFVRRSDAEHINHYLLQDAGRVVEHGMIGEIADRASAVAGEERAALAKAMWLARHGGGDPDWPVNVDASGRRQEPYVGTVPQWQWDGFGKLADVALADREAATSRAREEMRERCAVEADAEAALWSSDAGSSARVAAHRIRALPLSPFQPSSTNGVEASELVRAFNEWVPSTPPADVDAAVAARVALLEAWAWGLDRKPPQKLLDAVYARSAAPSGGE